MYTLGSSLGLTDTFSTGIVSNVERTIDGKRCIQFTAPISPGNSGGPLVNEDGKVIGIVTLTAVDGQNINFAVKSSLVASTARFEPVEISSLYEEKLEENAYIILQNYIYVNRNGEDGGKCYILKTKEETPTTYGYNWYFVYDQSTDTVYTEMFIVADGMNVWSIKLIIAPDFKYTVEFYDCAINQLTMSATFENKAGTDINTVKYSQERFDKAFSGVLNKYTDKTETGENEIEQAKAIIYQSFLISLRFMNDTVNNSGTGVDMVLIGIVIE
ncbi:MAG: serine protease [Clostridia bacterium]|nr:serine protease [Clostridia bacterium]